LKAVFAGGIAPNGNIVIANRPIDKMNFFPVGKNGAVENRF